MHTAARHLGCLGLTWLASSGELAGQDLEGVARRADGGDPEAAIRWMQETLRAEPPVFVDADEARDAEIDGIVRDLLAKPQHATADALQDLEARLRVAHPRVVERVRDAVTALCARSIAGARPTAGFSEPATLLRRQVQRFAEQQVAAGRVLARLDLRADTPLETLLEALRSDRGYVKLVAVDELAPHVRGSPEARGALFELLEGEPPKVQVQLELTIGSLYAGVDVRPHIYLHATRALWHAIPTDPRLVGHLHHILLGGTPSERRQVLLTLAEFGAAARAQLPHVLALLDHPDEDVVADAIVAIGMLGLPPEEEMASRTDWMRRLNDPDPDVRRKALAMLRSGARSASDAPRRLRSLAQHGNERIRRCAAAALERLGR